MKFRVHPVNTGLVVPIHDKYFTRNLTLHHFLLHAWNIPVSINVSDVVASTYIYISGEINFLEIHKPVSAFAINR